MADSSRLEEHLVAYIDLLGFSEALLPNNHLQLDNILSLLRRFAESKSEFSVQEERENRQFVSDSPAITSSITRVIPAITSFSDHVVISFQLTGVSQDLLTIALLQLGATIGSLSRLALEAGFLIRGGVEVGPLFHREGVVFGAALVEAFKLESKLAFYPRVVISSSVISRLGKVAGSGMAIVQRDDGIPTVPFLKYAMLKAGASVDQQQGQIGSWVTDARHIINDNMQRLQNAKNIRGYAKWSWFAKEFERTVSELPASPPVK